jgi:hypothetical protein
MSDETAAVRSLWLSMPWLRATSRVGRPRTGLYLRGWGTPTAARSIVIACSDSAGLLRAGPAAHLVRGSIMRRLVCRATTETKRHGNCAKTKATKRAHHGPAFQHSFLEWSLAVWQRGYVSTQGNCRMFARSRCWPDPALRAAAPPELAGRACARRGCLSFVCFG